MIPTSDDHVGAAAGELGVGDLRADVDPGQRDRGPERERGEQHRDEDDAGGQSPWPASRLCESVAISTS